MFTALISNPQVRFGSLTNTQDAPWDRRSILSTQNLPIPDCTALFQSAIGNDKDRQIQEKSGSDDQSTLEKALITIIVKSGKTPEQHPPWQNPEPVVSNIVVNKC